MNALTEWIDSHRDIVLDVIRIYLGVGLVVKGAMFVAHDVQLVQAVGAAPFGFAEGAVAHFVILSHIGGGTLLALGLATRWGALVQIPTLLGAVIFVHAKEGLFTNAQTLEFALLVLFLLCVFAVCGAGRLSLDYYLRESAPINRLHQAR